jgi:hypothetical protein
MVINFKTRIISWDERKLIKIWMLYYNQTDKSQNDPCEGLDDKTDRRIERRRLG